MKTGKVIYARTHAEFLNEAFGTNYKGYQKSSWKYDDKWVVWLVRFNQEVNGWRNTFVTESRIMQKNLKNVEVFEGMPITQATTKNRIVFEIVGNGDSRRYIFRGKFVYDEISSNAIHSQYLDKVADEF